MNEKSKAFELMEFVWNNEKTDSYLRVNIAEIISGSMMIWDIFGTRE